MPKRVVAGSPTIAGAHGKCPWCLRDANFDVVGNVEDLYHLAQWVMHNPYSGQDEHVATIRGALLRCQGCGDVSLIVEERTLNGLDDDPEWDGIRQLGENHLGPWTFAASWPAAGRLQMDHAVPEKVARPYSEAMRAIEANAPNAGTSMLRVVLSEMIDDKGSASVKASKGMLDAKLRAFIKEGGFGEGLDSWATHVKLYGNAGGHPDVFGNVTDEEARETASLMQTLIEAVYIWPATMQRRQAERMGRIGP